MTATATAHERRRLAAAVAGRRRCGRGRPRYRHPRRGDRRPNLQDSAAVVAHVRGNLAALLPWIWTADALPALAHATRAARGARTTRAFAHDGSPAVPSLRRLPILADDEAADFASLVLDAEAARALRVLSFVDQPPALLLRETVDDLRRLIFANSRCALRPTAIVMCGPPGSGKSASLDVGIETLNSLAGGPTRDAFVYINPDVWLAKLCGNDNALRRLANYCNHETFLMALGQKRHIIFDGTGRSPLNTCSRVIGRLLEAGYRVHMLCVLASYETCRRRIRRRAALIERDVPDAFLQATTRELRASIPKYIAGTATGLCESLMLFDNDGDTPPPPPPSDAPSASDEMAAGNGGGSHAGWSVPERARAAAALDRRRAAATHRG